MSYELTHNRERQQFGGTTRPPGVVGATTASKKKSTKNSKISNIVKYFDKKAKAHRPSIKLGKQKDVKTKLNIPTKILQLAEIPNISQVAYTEKIDLKPEVPEVASKSRQPFRPENSVPKNTLYDMLETNIFDKLPLINRLIPCQHKDYSRFPQVLTRKYQLLLKILMKFVRSFPIDLTSII